MDTGEQLIILEIQDSLATKEKEDGPNLSAPDSYSLLGLDTDQPILKIGNSVYRGRWETTIGTALLLKKNPDKVESASRDDALIYEGKTQKKIVFQRVQLLPKNPSPPAPVDLANHVDSMDISLC